MNDAPAGILSGLAAGCQVIAVNAPADAPKLEQVDLRLDSLAQIAVDKTAQARSFAGWPEWHYLHPIDWTPLRRGFYAILDLWTFAG